MAIQTNPAAFSKRLPVHTVIFIDRLKGLVTLSGSDGTTLNVRLDSWGNIEAAQPAIGGKVQLVESH